MSSAAEATFGDVRAVVFDFDGVILESGEIKTQAFLELFADHPEHLEAIKVHHLQNLAISRFVKFEWIYRELLGRSITETESIRLGERFTALVMEDMLRCPFVPGARKTLNAIEGRLPAFVASGTPQDELRTIVEAHRLTARFAGVFGSPSTKPEILGRLMAEHLLAPTEVLFIGDGHSDWTAAATTGVHFLARRTPEQSHWLDRISAPKVDDLVSLPRLLGLVESS